MGFLNMEYNILNFTNILMATMFLINAAHINAEDPCTITKFEDVSDIVQNCTNIILDGISVPGGKQLTIKLTEGSTLTFKGNTSFNFSEWRGPLVVISGTNFTVKGEGSVLDGQGPLWWDGKGTWGNTTKPRFMVIKATNAIIEGLTIKNCPVSCIKIKNSENVTIRNWKIDNLAGDEGVAPEKKFAHNVDGFGIADSTNILIEDSLVYNQDDCIALVSGKNITLRNLFCHGSHGLSLSAGAATIEDVLFENSITTMSRNGIHIKTHVDAGEGLIRNVMYRNITLLDSTNYGILIEQNYQNRPSGSEPQVIPPKNNIPIHNLTFIDIYGNVLQGAIPVYILCAEEGCFDWKWKGVKIYGQLSDNCTNYTPEGYDC